MSPTSDAPISNFFYTKIFIKNFIKTFDPEYIVSLNDSHR